MLLAKNQTFLVKKFLSTINACLGTFCLANVSLQLWLQNEKELVLFLVSGKHSTTNRFSALLMEQPMAARKSLPQRQMEQRTGDVKVDTAGVMTTRHLSFSRYCNCVA